MSDRVELRDYIEAILEEHRRAVLTAEQEREKSAAELRRAMEERISTGDQALRDHIEQQVQQIKAALDAVETLRKTNEDAQKEAVDKAFSAAGAIADKHNDLIRSMERKEDKFLPREVFDTIVSAWSDWRGEIDKALVSKEIYESRHIDLENRVEAVGAESTRWRESVEKRLVEAHAIDTHSATDAAKQTRFLVLVAGAGVTLFNTVLIIVANVLTSQ